jgi:hypothetical protein
MVINPIETAATVATVTLPTAYLVCMLFELRVLGHMPFTRLNVVEWKKKI